MNMYKYFISYESTTGTGYGENLKTALEKLQSNEQAFLADVSILKGKEWSPEIENALNECKYFIVIITALTTGSQEVMKEYQKAIRLGKRIISCRYSGIKVSETNEFAIHQQLDFKDTYELANKVIIGIKDIEKKESKGVKIGNDPEEFIRRGVLLLIMGRLDEALTEYKKVTELHPNYAKGWEGKGITLGIQNHYKESLDAINKASELTPQDALIWYNKGIILHQLGRFDEALDAYNKAIKINPNNSQAWGNKAVSLISLCRLDEALNACDEAIKLNPKDTLALANKGAILHSKEQFDEALKCSDEAIKINPNYILAWSNKTASLIKLCRFDDALKACNKVMELDPKNTGALFNKGFVFHIMGRFDEAIKCYDKAIQINPSYAGAWINKAASLVDLKKFDEAIKCYDKTIEISPNSINLFNRAYTYSLMRKKSETINDLAKAVNLDRQCSAIAKTNEDFKWLWDDPDFKQTVEEK